MQFLLERNRRPRHAAFAVGERALSLLERRVLEKPLALAVVSMGCPSALPLGCKGWGWEDLGNSPQVYFNRWKKASALFHLLAT